MGSYTVTTVSSFPATKTLHLFGRHIEVIYVHDGLTEISIIPLWTIARISSSNVSYGSGCHIGFEVRDIEFEDVYEMTLEDSKRFLDEIRRVLTQYR